MNKSVSFVKLDFLSIKQYLQWKQVGIFVVVLAFLSFTMKDVYFVSGMLMLFGLLYAAYPFAAGEKNQTDLLFASLPLRKKDVVIGRYLFAVALIFCAALLALGLSLIVTLTFQQTLDVLALTLTLGILFLFYLFILAIQFPLYFKLGYAKARIATVLPLFLIFFVVMITSSLISESIWLPALTGAVLWIEAHVLLTILIGLLLLACILAASAALSYRFYRKREF